MMTDPRDPAALERLEWNDLERWLLDQHTATDEPRYQDAATSLYQTRVKLETLREALNTHQRSGDVMAEKTLGQLADEGAAICVVFDLLSKLAFAKGWIPLGWRRFELPDDFIVTVNGTKVEQPDEIGVLIPPFHATVIRRGWPFGTFTMFGGVLRWGTEEALIHALRTALDESATQPGSRP